MRENSCNQVVNTLGLSLFCLPLGGMSVYRSKLLGIVCGGILSLGISSTIKDSYLESKTTVVNTPNVKLVHYARLNSNFIKEKSLAFLNPLTIFLHDKKDYTMLFIKFTNSHDSFCSYKLEGKFDVNHFESLDLKKPDSVSLFTGNYSRVTGHKQYTILEESSYEKNQYGHLCDTIFNSRMK